MEFKTLTEEEFKVFSNNHKYKNFFQTIETGLLREKAGFKKHFVGVIKNNKIIAASLLVSKTAFLKKKMFYAPRGFLIDFENIDLLEFFTNNVKKYAQSNNGLYIKIDPYVPYKERDLDGNIVENGFNNQQIINNLKKLNFKHYGFTKYHYKTEQVRWMFVLDIEDKTEDQILKEMKQIARRKIKRIKKSNYEIKELKKDEIDIFSNILKQTGNRKGFNSQSLNYFKNLYDIYSKSNTVKFLLVKLNLENYKNILSQNSKEKADDINKLIKTHGKEIEISSSVFITYGDEIIYLFGGNKEEFLTFNGQYALQWEMIKYGIKNNYKRFNFYGISGNFDPKDSQYGIYNFKRGFNGYVVELIGEFDLPTSYLYYIYKILKKVKRVIK